MKEAFNGPFKWKVRFTPPHETIGSQVWELTARAAVWHKAKPDTDGNYDEFNQIALPNTVPVTTYYHYYGYNDDNDTPAFPANGNQHNLPAGGANQDKFFFGKTDALTGTSYDANLPKPRVRFTCGAALVSGPLRVAQGAENPRYFYRTNTANQSEPVYLFGQARAWDRQYPGGYRTDFTPPAWYGQDLIDRQAMYTEMKTDGFNVNYVWLAPWETQPLHKLAQTEFWYVNNQRTKQTPVFAPNEWRAWSYYDQGRCSRMDEIIKGHTDNGIYVILNIFPHQALQHSSHEWGETGWNNKPNKEEIFGMSDLDALGGAGPDDPVRLEIFLRLDPMMRVGSGKRTICVILSRVGAATMLSRPG